MEKIGTVRLEALRLKNFKNVINGEIYFSEKKKVKRGDIDEDDFSSILGIYGQNGSGKTACLDALRLLQTILSGINIPTFYMQFINNQSNNMSVGADFLITRGNINYYVQYDINIASKLTDLNSGQKKADLEIESEKFSYYKIDSQRKKNNIFSYTKKEKISNSFLAKLDSKDSAIYSYTCEYESNTFTNANGLFSTIFNAKLVGLLQKNQKEELAEYSKLLLDLRAFATTRLAIYSISYFNESENIGIRIRIKEERKDDKMLVSCGDIFVPFSVNSLPRDQFLIFRKNINIINKVLPSIIPNYTVDVAITSNVMNRQDVVSFMLVSKRKDSIIPLIHESNGIKKIISILSGFIDAYNHEGCLMVVDELDSGIFEYLLGEIVYAFENFGRGQLLFTSHNLRALEKLNYRNIMFTTTDHNNAFIQLSSIKDNNNLRNLYYKCIANGYKGNIKLYDMVKTNEMISKLYLEDEK